MSNAIARILCASTSVMLSCTLALASASASVPADAAAPQARVRFADLNLSSSAGRETLERRLRTAVDTVCGGASTPFQAATCRGTARASARVAVQRAIATAS